MLPAKRPKDCPRYVFVGKYSSRRRYWRYAYTLSELREFKKQAEEKGHKVDKIWSAYYEDMTHDATI